MGRGIIIALLVVSLGLNVFALGHFSGRMIGGHRAPPGIEQDSGPGLEDPFRILRYAGDLSPELRDTVRDAFRSQLPQIRDEHKTTRLLRRQLSDLMAADAWDGAAVEAKLAEIRASQNRQQDALTAAFITAFEKLSPAERKALIEAARQGREAHHKRWRDGRDGPRRGPRGPHGDPEMGGPGVGGPDNGGADEPPPEDLPPPDSE